MADTKISNLTALTTPLAADVLAIVDTAGSETKQITFTNFYATPEPIGATTPNTGSFTTLIASSITVDNTGLHILDTDASHDLIIIPGSNLTADRNLTFTTGDVARAITINGDPTLDNWFDQSVKTTVAVIFDDITVSTPSNIYGLSHDSFADFLTTEHFVQSAITTVGTVTVGNVDAVVSTADLTTAGKIEVATIAETTTGTDAGRAISPDGLSGSDYGKRVIQVLVTDPNGDVLTTGDGKAHIRIPAVMSGWNLVEVAAKVTTVSTSGTPTIQIHNLTQTVDMLSTLITIDVNEKDSSSATTPAVIDTTNDDVATADELRIDVDVAGTGTKGLIVEMIFQNP